MLQPEVAISAIFNEREAIVKNDAFISFKNTPTHSLRVTTREENHDFFVLFARDVTKLPPVHGFRDSPHRDDAKKNDFT